MRNQFFITLIIVGLNSYAQQNKCSQFKTGKFEFSEPKYAEWQVTRTDSTQIELNTKTGLEIYNSVKWVNDCEYLLTCDKVVNPTSANIVGEVYHVKMTEVYSNRYTCIAVSKNDDITLNLMMIKVETFTNQ